jgi:EmrB/QacA subfamily drug resistance transporter
MAGPPAAISSQMDDTFSIRQIMAPLVAIIVGVFMVVLDATAVNVAVPSLVRDLHSSLSLVQWTITGYALAQAAVIPLAGWLSDRFGAKRIFTLSIGLFTLGSVLCAVATSAEMLVFFRLLQGLGGGCVLPIAMAYVYRLAPSSKVGAVMGVMGIPILFAPAIAPVLAGWLVQYASWRWIFLLNFPIGIFGVFLALRTLPSVERQRTAGLDLLGTMLGPLAFAGLSYGISQGSTSWTGTRTIGGIVVGGLALIAFIVVELRAETPLLELRVFRAADFNWAIIVQWIAQFALFGTLFLVPLFLQEVRGYGAFDTGLILLPQAIAAGVFMPISGMLFDRIGARPLVIGGSALIAISAFLLTGINETTRGTNLILPLALMGAGMGLMMMSLNTQVINAAPRKLVSRVTSLTNALQQVVSSLTIAALATILTSRATLHTSAAKAAFAVQHPHPTGTGATTALQVALGHAFALAFDDTFRVLVVGAVIATGMGFILRRIALQTDEPEVAEDGVEVPRGALVNA